VLSEEGENKKKETRHDAYLHKAFVKLAFQEFTDHVEYFADNDSSNAPNYVRELVHEHRYSKRVTVQSRLMLHQLCCRGSANVLIVII
jgi:hypothetical protein